MHLTSRSLTTERIVHEFCRCASRFLSLELVKKTLFIVFTAALLTSIVVYSGTSRTPPVDVFVYCLVYSGWVTICLPWLVQNMTGKILALIVGVLVRLFAVDVGVLAWSAVRGHRHIFQRGLRLKPLFEPSMSWLAEAGYNLRYGVVIAAIVASVVSLLIDLYERFSNSSAFPFKRSPFFKRRNSWLASINDNAWEETHATKKPRYQEGEYLYDNNSPRSQKWDGIHHRETKANKIGTTVRFTNADDTDSFRVRQRDEPNSPKCRKAVYVTGKFDSDECDGYSQKRKRLEQEEKMQSTIASWRRNDVCKGSSREPCSKSEFPTLGYQTNEISVAEEGPVRTRTVGLEHGSPMNKPCAKNKSQCSRPQSASSVESKRLKPGRGPVGRGHAKRSYRNERSNQSEEMQTSGRRNTKNVIEDTLNESLLNLRKLRGKL
ncbi:hypothetical protein BsWGS_23493 [Bradybaena similaris]